MQIVISKKLSKKVSEVSKAFGWIKEKVVNQALMDYLDSMISLKKEMEAWDKLSDEALLKFEKDLEESCT